jgi:hypothetical protein
MLVAIRDPRRRHDALLLGSIIVATAARLQLIVLVPAALTAALLAGALEREPGVSAARSVVRRVVQHRWLFGGVAATLVLAGGGALVGQGVFSAFGRYANVGRVGLPNLWHFLNLTVRHLAGLDLAVGVAPFAGALVAAFAFIRFRPTGDRLAFALVSASFTAWLLLEVAWDAAKFDSPHGDIPRIHERFLIYVVPLFLVALLATVPLAARLSKRVYLGAAICAALLPIVIPFDTMINSTISVDTFGLEPFARIVNGVTVPAQHATLRAIWIAATFGLLYVVVRERQRTIVILVLIAFVLISGLTWSRIESGGLYARATLPAERDWVDRAKPSGDVVLLTANEFPASALETAYHNRSIARLYYVCARRFGPEFGEDRVTIDRAGRLRDSEGAVTARYAVVPAGLVVRGRIVATNPNGFEVLVAPQDGRLILPPGTPAVRCASPNA